MNIEYDWEDLFKTLDEIKAGPSDEFSVEFGEKARRMMGGAGLRVEKTRHGSVMVRRATSEYFPLQKG